MSQLYFGLPEYSQKHLSVYVHIKRFIGYKKHFSLVTLIAGIHYTTYEIGIYKKKQTDFLNVCIENDTL